MLPLIITHRVTTRSTRPSTSIYHVCSFHILVPLVQQLFQKLIHVHMLLEIEAD